MSELLPNEFIIHDTTDESVFIPQTEGRGLNLALRGPNDYEYGATADPFPAELLIDPSEYQSRIQEMEQKQSRLSDLIRASGLPPKNQESTNYCWFNAPTHCLEIVRVQQNQPMVILSPASGAAQVTNYRNVGGWGQDALNWIIEHGVCPVSDWPANAIDRRYATAANNQIALNYRVGEWTELKPRTMNQLMSMLLRRIPVAVGYNWWGHEVTACDPVWLDGQAAIRIRNSWGAWGDGNGFAVLQGSKCLPDDAVAPRTALAT